MPFRRWLPNILLALCGYCVLYVTLRKKSNPGK
jgi:hypothetical protein